MPVRARVGTSCLGAHRTSYEVRPKGTMKNLDSKRSASQVSETEQEAIERRRKEQERRLQIKVGIALGLAVALLAGIFIVNRESDAGVGAGSEAGQAGRFEFAVGEPGPGSDAPVFELASSAGETFELGEQDGQTVLLYFHEGLTCQPCWDQIVDLEGELDGLRKLGIDELVSITTDPIDQIEQKVADEGIGTAVLSDPELDASEAYSANQYGMMGESRDGHSFVVVGPDGVIRWRADYGGPPNFTMYVPVSDLLADIEQGLENTS